MAADLIKRLDFFAAMMSSGTFTPSALTVAFALLYRHMNGHTGRCDPSTATLADETGLTGRGVVKAIAELRKSGWWQIDQGGGRGRTNSYEPILERPNDRSGFGAEKGEQPFGVLSPKTPNRKVKNPERLFTRTGKNQKESDSAAWLPNEFQAFWRVYPSRAPHPNPKKPAAQKFAAAIERDIDPAAIIAGARRYAAYVAREGMKPKFVKQAMVWLNQELWDEPYEPADTTPRLPIGMN
jgi:Helix-turn-helix domain